MLTSRLVTAHAYAATAAHVMRVIPLTGYQYCWSPKTSDLLFAAKKLERATTQEIEEYLISQDYREDDLSGAHESGHEVMLFCNVYVVIPLHIAVIGNKQENTPHRLVEKYSL